MAYPYNMASTTSAVTIIIDHLECVTHVWSVVEFLFTRLVFCLCIMCSTCTCVSVVTFSRLGTNRYCVCVFSSHPFWTSSSLDVPAGVTQEEGHTGFLIHLPSAVRALIFVARRIQPFLSLVFLLFSFPCSADHERDWPPCKVVFSGWQPIR